MKPASERCGGYLDESISETSPGFTPNTLDKRDLRQDAATETGLGASTTAALASINRDGAKLDPEEVATLAAAAEILERMREDERPS